MTNHSQEVPMKLIIERNQLMNSIQHVMKAISSRPTIAILSGIKLEAQQNFVKLTGSDSDITIESTIPREEDGMINIHDVNRVPLFYKRNLYQKSSVNYLVTKWRSNQMMN